MIVHRAAHSHSDRSALSRNLISILAIVALAICMGGFMAAFAPSSWAATSAEKHAEADQKQAEADAIEQRINELQDQLNAANAEIERATAEHDKAAKAAEDAQKRKVDSEKRIGELQDELAERAAYLYRSDVSSSMLDVLLGASSFRDFLTNWDTISRIIAHDNELVAETKAVKAEAEAAEVEYREQTEKAQQEMDAAAAAKAELESTQASMQAELAKVTEEVAMLKAQEEELKLAEEAAKARAEAAAQSASSIKANTALGFGMPLGSYSVTSEFGWRPWSGTYHQGIDLAANGGDPIYAAKAGTVTYVGWYGGGGNTVIVNHGDGMRTVYMHMSRFGSTVGQQVAQGQVIGYVGTTGHSTGNHLHFQVEVGGTPINPRNILSF